MEPLLLYPFKVNVIVTFKDSELKFITVHTKTPPGKELS